MTAQDTSSDIVARAQALIEQVQRQLDQADDFYRSQGLDPHKVHIVVQAQSTAETRAKAQAAFEEDMQAIEQEVAEGRARLAFDSGSASSAARRPRMMI